MPDGPPRRSAADVWRVAEAAAEQAGRLYDDLAAEIREHGPQPPDAWRASLPALDSLIRRVSTMHAALGRIRKALAGTAAEEV